MLAQGHLLKAIADVLGHVYLGSALIYTKVDFEHLKQLALPWPGEARRCAHESGLAKPIERFIELRLLGGSTY